MNTIKQSIIEKLKEYALVQEGVPMSEFTSFKTGGSADILVYPHDDVSAAQIIKTLHDEDLQYHVLGGCSNLVVSDNGLRGVVIKMSEEGGKSTELKLSSDGLIYADAGVKKLSFIQYAVDNGFGGVEFMVGIPGCIGGGIIMNAGTYMGTFSDVLTKVRYIDLKGEIKEELIDKSKVAYRDMNLEEDAALLLGGYFKLPRADNVAEVKSRIDEINADRKTKHPLEYPSAGSVFKNPEGHSSWKLVNDSGLKGFAIGGAAVSEKHTNFIINKDRATSAEIRALVTYIQQHVADTFGIDLHTEIRMIGEFH